MTKRKDPKQSAEKLGFHAAWSMAVGGMVGGGIFATLGVVIDIAGSWAWLSLLLAGIVSFISGYCYVKLASLYDEGGGAFTYLREAGAERVAASLAWLLIAGYVLANAVYAFTFGEYLSVVLDVGDWLPRVAAIVMLAIFTGLNLRSVGESGRVEILLVWFKLAILLGLVVAGLFRWDPSRLSQGVESAGPENAMLGAATVFMAYQGFQLLTYNYRDIRQPKRVLPPAVLLAVVMVTVTYILVALAAAMLVGAGQIVEQREIALAAAGREVLGTTGAVIVTVAAVFATGSAINATIFASSRLMRKVAERGELPFVFSRQNRLGVPSRAVLTLGIASAFATVLGSLQYLVQATSLAFLLIFTIVCGLAFKARAGHRIISATGFLGALAAAILLATRLVRDSPVSLAVVVGTAILALVIRPLIGDGSSGSDDDGGAE